MTVIVSEEIDVKEYLPHREPFLFVDKVVEIDEKRIEAIYNVTGKEFFFEGHFPGNPVMPGSLLFETIAQTGALLILVNRKMKAQHDQQIFPMKATEIIFKDVVRPGNTLHITVESVRKRSKHVMFSGQIIVKGEVKATAKFLGGIWRLR